ncbi:hypothetical protein KP509_27G009200 [Ceratopteris richardii]|uniref:Uncharacterized protein n=1 Tax=Ceratopteris richardii TaxID=49495 RepID=A0A8T2RFA3_CERRI|nr:hypothetical protein KP509_27G009200 [Ceratopteris richardii]
MLLPGVEPSPPPQEARGPTTRPANRDNVLDLDYQTKSGYLLHRSCITRKILELTTDFEIAFVSIKPSSSPKYVHIICKSLQPSILYNGPSSILLICTFMWNGCNVYGIIFTIITLNCGILWPLHSQDCSMKMYGF